MKKLILLSGALFLFILSFSQVSKSYFTGNIKTNFEWNLIDKSNASRDVPHQLISSNGINLAYGRRLNTNIIVELGSEILHYRELKEALLFNAHYTDFNLSLGFGYSDTLARNWIYVAKPYYQVLRGFGKFDSNDGYETGDIERGADIFGIRLGVEKAIYKHFGIRGGIDIRYENIPDI
ncbi:hypothetical protein OAP07_01270 [Bacteroidia bacterium]|nr:hypothetical protein [Bacteroidia bacterium]MDC0560682.1 hypothetical protein [Bacteroidia bacterium]MDC3407220.1 hypothetical protein [Bacteroidia bacterium]